MADLGGASNPLILHIWRGHSAVVTPESFAHQPQPRQRLTKTINQEINSSLNLALSSYPLAKLSFSIKSSFNTSDTWFLPRTHPTTILLGIIASTSSSGKTHNEDVSRLPGRVRSVSESSIHYVKECVNMVKVPQESRTTVQIPHYRI